MMHQLGRQPEAKAYLAVLHKSEGAADSYQYAEIYAQWGDRQNALAWLATAYKVRDTGLVTMKTDPLLDPIRATPEFAAMERQLDFPP